MHLARGYPRCWARATRAWPDSQGPGRFPQDVA